MHSILDKISTRKRIEDNDEEQDDIGSVLQRLAPSLDIAHVLLWAGILMLAWLPYIIAFFPGIVEIDTALNIYQGLGHGYISAGDTLTPGFTSKFTVLGMYVFSGFVLSAQALFGSQLIGIGALCIVQSVLTAIGVSTCLGWTEKVKLGYRTRIAIGAVFALFPLFPMLSIDIGKDGFFTWCYLLWAVYMMEVLRTRGASLSESWYREIGSALAVLCCLTKTSGVAVIALCGIIAFFVCVNGKKNVFVSNVVIPIAVLVACGAFLFPALGFYGGNAREELLSVAGQQTIRCLLDHPDDVNKWELMNIGDVIDINKAEDLYSPEVNDGVKTSLLENPTASDISAFLTTWSELGLRHPDSYAAAIWDIVKPFVISTGSYADVAMPYHLIAAYTPDRMSYMTTNAQEAVVDSWNENVASIYSEGRYAITATILPEYGNIGLGDWYFVGHETARNMMLSTVYNISQIPVVGFVLSKALFAFWIPLACLVLVLFSKNKRIVILLPMFAMILIAFCSPVALMRYIAPLVFTAPITIGYAIACFGQKSEEVFGITH